MAFFGKKNKYTEKSYKANSQIFATGLGNIADSPSISMPVRRALKDLGNQFKEIPNIKDFSNMGSVDDHILQMIGMMEKYKEEGKNDVVYTFIDIVEKVIRKRAKGEAIEKKEMDAEITIVEEEAMLMYYLLKSFEHQRGIDKIKSESKNLVKGTPEYILQKRRYDKEKSEYDKSREIIKDAEKTIEVNRIVFESYYGANAISLMPIIASDEEYDQFMDKQDAEREARNEQLDNIKGRHQTSKSNRRNEEVDEETDFDRAIREEKEKDNLEMIHKAQDDTFDEMFEEDKYKN